MHMKKNIFVKSLLLIGAALLTVSCSKEYLDTASESSESPATIFETTDNAKMAINGIARMMTTQYLGSQGMNGEGTIKNWYGNYSGNDAQKCGLTGWALLINSNHHENPDSQYLYYPWFYFYKIIGNANSVLANIDGADGPQSERDFIKAQALVYRAYSYMMLVQFYCQRWSDNANDGIPLRLDTSTGDLAKTPTKGVYTQIYKDLDEAIQLFGASGLKRASSEFYLPDIDVAYAVYARAALNREDWENAAKYAALARKDHDLMTQKQYMQSGFSVPNSDWIWGVYDAGDQTIYYYSYFAYCGSNSNAGACRNYPFAISKELYDQIPETDVRRNLWLAPTAEEMEETYVDKGDGKTYRCISRTSGLASAGSLFHRGLALRGNGLTSKLYSTSQIYMYMQLKFQAQDLPGVGSFHLFRAGEMAFIEAEADCHLNRDAQAQKILEEVNKTFDASYSCSKTGADLLNEVKLYRRIHLWGEGYDWFDYKRWGEPIVRKSIANGGSWHSTFAITMEPAEKNNWTFLIPNRENNYNKLINQFVD